MVLLLLLTARSRRTRKADQKCPEKQDKKSKRDMNKIIPCPFKNILKWTRNDLIFKIGQIKIMGQLFEFKILAPLSVKFHRCPFVPIPFDFHDYRNALGKLVDIEFKFTFF